ncbi:class I SAM-dependent methyltransferase [Gayadomonas joobiniege]|uniref:class I SAM-dependent methyltransferase n=1 Tax=Gayadomonas joobiniege TaxID=1234606 RepID=UPI0003702DB3|nr:class I SAM-dependent methyltransferase [Gayadomonas joobiniege]
MKPALQDILMGAPASWHEIPQGGFIRKQIERHLNQWLPKVFGYHFLKVGQLSSEIDTQACTIKHQVNVAAEGARQGVITDIHHLPFKSQSADAILLAHTLDYTHDPHQVLREAHRVLMADGYLFISGFNPFSIAGLYKLWPGNKADPIRQARFFPPARIGDWLSLLGCEVVQDHRFIYNLPGRQPAGCKNRWMPSFTHQYLTRFGSVYLLVARKRELPLTPIKPKWKVKPALAPIGNVSIGGGARSGKTVCRR